VPLNVVLCSMLYQPMI